MAVGHSTGHDRFFFWMNYSFTVYQSSEFGDLEGL